jgi:hypothetical protein
MMMNDMQRSELSLMEIGNLFGEEGGGRQALNTPCMHFPQPQESITAFLTN